jgi:hypothetical protein
MTTKKIIIILLLLLITIPIITAEEVTTDSQIRNLIIQQEILTRKEIKDHFDKTKKELEKFFEKEGKKFIDDNFKAIDNKIRKEFNILLIKGIIGIITSILFAQIIFYILKRKIKSMEERKKAKVPLKEIQEKKILSKEEDGKIQESKEKGLLKSHDTITDEGLHGR